MFCIEDPGSAEEDVCQHDVKCKNVIWYSIISDEKPGSAEEDVWRVAGASIGDTHNRQVRAL